MNDTGDDRVERTQFHLEVGGHRLHVQRLRPRPGRCDRLPLVFLHEGLGSVAQWTARMRGTGGIDVPAHLAEATGRAAIVYDRLGFGGSDALPADRQPGYLYHEAGEVLPWVLDGAGIGAAVLIGHSDGASIALLFAARHGQRAAGIVSEAAHVIIEDLTLEGIRRARAAYHAPDSKLRAALARHHGAKADHTFRNWADVWLDPAFAAFDMTDELPRIRCPVLAIQGDGDEYGSPDQLTAIAAGVAGPVDTWLVPDCGHVPHFQAHDRVLPRIVDFLESLD